MFTVMEIQSDGQGNVSVLPAIVTPTRAAAESAYHSILAAAAVSQVPVHSALVLGEEGLPIMQFAYRHAPEASAEEVEPEVPAEEEPEEEPEVEDEPEPEADEQEPEEEPETEPAGE